MGNLYRNHNPALLQIMNQVSDFSITSGSNGPAESVQNRPDIYPHYSPLHSCVSDGSGLAIYRLLRHRLFNRLFNFFSCLPNSILQELASKSPKHDTIERWQRRNNDVERFVRCTRSQLHLSVNAIFADVLVIVSCHGTGCIISRRCRFFNSAPEVVKFRYEIPRFFNPSTSKTLSRTMLWLPLPRSVAFRAHSDKAVPTIEEDWRKPLRHTGFTTTTAW